MANGLAGGLPARGWRTGMALFRQGVLYVFAALRRQILADRFRWPLWLPVGVAAGAGLYFAVPVEPSWFWGAAAGVYFAAASSLAALNRAARWRVLLALTAAMALGFAAGKLRTEQVRAPVLGRQIGPVRLVARVVEAEPRANGSRMLLEPLPIERLADQTPARIRLTVRASSPVPAPGSWVAVLAILMPPPSPSMPGDYDFGRWAYYQRIGAVGYLYGRPRAIEEIRPPTFRERMLGRLQRLRGQMTARVRDVIPGPNGVIGAALITGERADIDPDDQNAFRDSGLMHVLSISGLHLALAGGFFFWTIRALLALFPSIVLRFPVKKWAAVAALAGATFYLLISGCEAPAVRSWLMLSMMFFAILVDRPALSMRSVAIAALVIVLVTPESVLDAGCQMSFAAVIGLIALAEWGESHRKPDEIRKPLWRKAWRYFVGIAVTSTVAGLATAPIAIFHFDRASPFGIIANLAALPVVGVVIMPAAVAAMVLMPFGLDRWALVAMGKGVGVMLAIAHWVAEMPGAGAVVPSWPGWCVAAVMGGGLWIALWRQRWRWLGLGPIVVGICLALVPVPPDILVARDARTVAVRLGDGRLAFVLPPTDRFAAENWLRRSGDARHPNEAVGGLGLRCDSLGCLAKLQGHTIVAIDQRAEALAEDCTNAQIVVSMVAANNLCIGPQLVIDRIDVARNGGYAVWLSGKLRVRTVQSERGERPWSAP